MVSSSGLIQDGVIVIVVPLGRKPPEGVVPGGAGVPVAGGVGATGDELSPLEHAAIAADTMRKQKRRNTAMVIAGGASGSFTVSRLPQRGEWVYRSRSAGRNHAGEERDRAEERGHCNERHRIERAHAVDESRQGARQNHRASQACR